MITTAQTLPKEDTVERFKLFWFTDIPEHKAIGNAYGYAVHNRTLRKYVSEIADLSQDAEDVLLIIAPEFYAKKVPGKTNWLFTMFEGETLPDPWVENVQRADYLLTPSTWVREKFSKYFPKDKIFVVNHGVEPCFAYKKRRFPRNEKPFRFLWVGAPNERKGWKDLIYIWEYAGYSRSPHIELYLKTTMWGKVERRGNVILDGRKLPLEDLIKLYHSAHCFLFPTHGEGFGLTLAEAMRTGLPCISTYYSGVTDFFDETVGYPVDYKLEKKNIYFRSEALDEPGACTYAAAPKWEQFSEKMLEVYENYNKALRKGKKAYQRIAGQFTWPKAARTLVDIMTGVRYGFHNN